MCNMIAHQALIYLHSPETKEMILDGAIGICDMIPEPLGEKCRELVKEEGPELLESAISMLTPRLLCESIGMCQPKAPHPKPPVGLTGERKEKMRTDFVNFIKSSLKSPVWCDVFGLGCQKDSESVRSSQTLLFASTSQ